MRQCSLFSWAFIYVSFMVLFMQLLLESDDVTCWNQQLVVICSADTFQHLLVFLRWTLYGAMALPLNFVVWCKHNDDFFFKIKCNKMTTEW